MEATIAIVSNPLAGRGEAEVLLPIIRSLFTERGYQITGCELPAKSIDIASVIGAAEVVILLGGDGSLLSLLPFLSSAAVPVYMAPVGNENLFSKEFGMSKQPDAILAAVEKRKVVEHCIGVVGEKMFFHMASVGLDSEVIELISKTRKGQISHRSYILPTLKTLCRHRPPVLRIAADGRRVIESCAGYFIAANSKQYACGLQLVPDADSLADSLSARFIPYSSRFYYLSWLTSILTGRCPQRRTARAFDASTFIVESVDGRQPVQADGELVGYTPINITRAAEKLRVLLPASN